LSEVRLESGGDEGVSVTVRSSDMRFDFSVPVPEGMSREELIVGVRRQAAQAGQLAEFREANDALAGKLGEILLANSAGC
jgi:hypothetical protein